MAKNNRNEGNRGRGGRDNDSMFRGWSDSARERPLASVAVAAAAVGAGVFLWSRRNQISEQFSNLSDQISDWTDNMRSGQSDQFESAGAGGQFSGSSISSSPTGSSQISGGSTRSSTTGTRASSGRGGGRKGGMSPTGGGNASLGASGGTTGTGAGS